MLWHGRLQENNGRGDPYGRCVCTFFSEISSDVEYVTNVLAGDGRLSIMGQVYDRETYALSQKLITLDIATGAQTSRELVVDGDKKDDSEQISLQTIAVYKDGYMAVRYHYTQPTQEEIDSGVYESETSYDIAILDADLTYSQQYHLRIFRRRWRKAEAASMFSTQPAMQRVISIFPLIIQCMSLTAKEKRSLRWILITGSMECL